MITEGKRAITVRVNDVIGVAGFALPGNYVDVIVHLERDPTEAERSARSALHVSKIVLERILVLAVAQEVSRDDTKPRVVNAVTLEVTPEQAETPRPGAQRRHLVAGAAQPDRSEIAAPPPAPPSAPCSTSWRRRRWPRPSRPRRAKRAAPKPRVLTVAAPVRRDCVTRDQRRTRVARVFLMPDVGFSLLRLFGMSDMDKGIGQHTTCAMRLGAWPSCWRWRTARPRAAAQPAAAGESRAGSAPTAARAAAAKRRVPASMALSVGKSTLMRLPEPVLQPQRRQSRRGAGDAGRARHAVPGRGRHRHHQHDHPGQERRLQRGRHHGGDGSVRRCRPPWPASCPTRRTSACRPPPIR